MAVTKSAEGAWIILIMIPALVWLLPHLGAPPEHVMHLAVGTSLATIAGAKPNSTVVSSAAASVTDSAEPSILTVCWNGR